MKMTTIHSGGGGGGEAEAGRKEKVIRGERCLDADGAAEREKDLFIYIFICEGEEVCACVQPSVRRCRSPKSAAAAGRGWDLCSKQPAGYLKALGPVLD